MSGGNHDRGFSSEYQRMRKENKRMRDALKDIRELAELRGPSMWLISLEHIEEIVDSTLQEDGDES